MLEASLHCWRLHVMWDHTELPARGSISRPYPGRCYGRYSIYAPVKDEKLSRPDPTQVNDLPRIATEVPAIPDVSWLSRPSAPSWHIRCKQLAHSCYAGPASAGFEPMSFKHESNVLSTWPPMPLVGCV